MKRLKQVIVRQKIHISQLFINLSPKFFDCHLLIPLLVLLKWPKYLLKLGIVLNFE